MVDAVGGSAIATQLRGATSLGVEAIRNEREQNEAVVRAVEHTTREIRHDSNESNRGRHLDVKA